MDGKLIRLPARTAADSGRIIEFSSFGKVGTGYWWAMTLRSTELIIGASVFNTLDEEYEIAWHLNPDHCGCGYMKEAVDTLMVWAVE